MLDYLTQEQKRALLSDMIDKVRGNTDLEWSDIVDEYDLTMSAETLRKSTVGIKLILESGMQITDEIKDTSYDKAFRERTWLNDQRREYNSLLRKDARAEHLYDIITSSALKLNEEKPLRAEYQLLGEQGESKKEAVLVLSDWHYGQTANNIYNVYSTEICRERVAAVACEAMYQCKLHQVKKLHVFILGDMIEGCLRASSRVASEELAADQVIHVSELLAELIDALAENVREICVYSTWGNHGRMVQNFADSIHADNVEKIIGWWLRTRFIDADNIRFPDANWGELIRANVCGYTVIGTHGDLDMDRDAVLKLNAIHQNEHGARIDWFIAGHAHEIKGAENSGIPVIGAGCLNGTDEYAKNKRLFSRPGQTMLIFRPDCGVESRIDIRL